MRFIRFTRNTSQVHQPTLQPNASLPPSRIDILLHDYEMLRQDERSYLTVLVALGSVIALVGGTSAFFLLQSCAVTHDRGCHAYPLSVYALLPGPTLAGCALIVQQAMIATIRGRLMLAVEKAIVAERCEVYRLAHGYAPAMTAYHIQQPLISGRRGVALWALMFGLPFIPILGMLYYCGTEFHAMAQGAYYGIYTAIVGLILWSGSPTFRGYEKLDSWLVQYLDNSRTSDKKTA